MTCHPFVKVDVHARVTMAASDIGGSKLFFYAFASVLASAPLAFPVKLFPTGPCRLESINGASLERRPSRRGRRQAQIATGMVGLITHAQQAEQILVSEDADAVFLGRAMLTDHYWHLHAAKELGAEMPWTVYYERAKI